MRISTIILSVTVFKLASASILIRQPECAVDGGKCAGEADQPLFPYKECCNKVDNVCGIPKQGLEAGVWGRFCIKKADALASSDVTETVDTVATNAPTTATNTPILIIDPTAAITNAPTVAIQPTVSITTEVATAVPDTTTVKDESTTETTASTTAAVSTTTEEPTTTATTVVTTTKVTKKDDAKCFPSSATVELQDGSTVPIGSVSVGDMVRVGVNEYSRVFMFTHRRADVKSNFVAIKTASGAELSLTSGHFLYVNGALSAAKTVVTGDELILGNGDVTSVISVGSVEGTGLFNPQTVQGNVVVNGVLSSTYTTAVDPSIAHAVLSPFRMFQNFGFTFTALESGWDALANAPLGQAAL